MSPADGSAGDLATDPARGEPSAGLTVVADDEITLDEFYEHAPVGYLTLSPQGLVVRVNQTFLDWTAFAHDELIGRRFTETLSMGGRIYFETHCAPLLMAEGEVREIALDVVCADGHRLPVLFGAQAVVTPAGATVTRVTVFDATHRRRYERRLQTELDDAREARTHAEATAVRLSKAPKPAPSDLSGLPNARWWAVSLEQALRQARKSGRSVVLAHVEIDHFERYSQVNGHDAGDQLLLQTLDVWRRAGHDLLARTDAERFATPLPGMSLAVARELVERLRRGTGAATEFSVGLALWDGSETRDALGARAQKALVQDQRKRGVVGR